MVIIGRNHAAFCHSLPLPLKMHTRSIWLILGLSLTLIYGVEVSPRKRPDIPHDTGIVQETSDPIKALDVQQYPEIPTKKPIPVDVPTVPDNQQKIWSYFAAKSMPAHQIAGIMGNLQQEHNFNTGDSPGGLGIAQWTANRRLNLLSRPNPYTIETQLDYLWHELSTSEVGSLQRIKASDSIASATIAFQDGFERCGVCMQSKRIDYAHNIYARFVR